MKPFNFFFFFFRWCVWNKRLLLLLGRWIICWLFFISLKHVPTVVQLLGNAGSTSSQISQCTFSQAVYSLINELLFQEENISTGIYRHQVGWGVGWIIFNIKLLKCYCHCTLDTPTSALISSSQGRPLHEWEMMTRIQFHP